MSNLPNLPIESWDSGNTQPELVFNQLASMVDALVPTPVVADKDLNAPPGSPALGSLYIVGPAPTGIWAGRPDQLVSFTYANAWAFIPPREGWVVYVADEDKEYRFYGSAGWIEVTGGGGSGIPDAPSDGTIYGRQNAAWVDVGGAVSGVSDVNGATGSITLAQGANVTIVESPTGTFTVNASGGGGGGSVPWKDFVADYGADPTFTSDCGPAWDAFVADVVANGSMALHCGAGHYKFSRALQNTSAENAQMPLPSVNYVAEAPVSIYLFGDVAPPAPFSVIGAEPDYAPGLTIFESTLTSGTGSMVAGFGASGSLNSITNVQVVLRDVFFRLAPNPTISGLNLENAASCDVDRVLIDTGSIVVANVTTPTHATSYGFKGPKNGNGANSRYGTIDVMGFYNGYSWGEHTNGTNIKATACIWGGVFLAADHASIIQRFMTVHCANGIKGPASGAHVVKILEYATEHAVSGPFVSMLDVSDTANTLYGAMEWRIVLAGSGGNVTNFAFDGCRNFEVQPIGGLDAVRVITGNDVAEYFDAGRIIRSNAGSGAVVTIPPDSSVPWKIGSVLTWVQHGAGQLSVAAGAGVTVRVPHSNTSAVQYSTIQAVNIGTDTWALAGDYT